VHFGAVAASIQFAARYLALPLARDETDLRQMLRRALPLTVLPYRRDRLFAARVRQLLASDPPMLRGATLLAEHLHLSERTLHRQLQQEGASLQQLKNEVRLSQATRLLRHGERPIKQVALAVGFINEKSLSAPFAAGRAWRPRSGARSHARPGRWVPPP